MNTEKIKTIIKEISFEVADSYIQHHPSTPLQDWEVQDIFKVYIEKALNKIIKEEKKVEHERR